MKLFATGRTADTLNAENITCEKINKVTQGSPHIVEYLDDKKIDIVINTTSGKKSIEDSKSLRRSALNNTIPYFTTLAGAIACTEAIASMKSKTNGKYYLFKNCNLGYWPISFKSNVIDLNTSSVFFNFFFFHTMPTIFVAAKKITIIIFIRNGLNSF